MNVFHAAGRGPFNVVITCVRDRTRIHGYMLDVSGPALLYNSFFLIKDSFIFKEYTGVKYQLSLITLGHCINPNHACNTLNIRVESLTCFKMRLWTFHQKLSVFLPQEFFHKSRKQAHCELVKYCSITAECACLHKKTPLELGSTTYTLAKFI